VKPGCDDRKFRFRHSYGYDGVGDGEDFPRAVVSLWAYVLGEWFFVKGFLRGFIIKAFLPVTHPCRFRIKYKSILRHISVASA
jgi:hypothetical protein